MAGKKNNQKSIRMSDEVLAFVEKQKGEGFNQKFENTVHKFSKAEKELDEKLKQKQKEYDELTVKVTKLRKAALNLQFIESEVKRCNAALDRYVTELEKEV